MYKIYGDYGYTSETLLEESDIRYSAIQWAERYVKGGDLGGYSVIEVGWHAADGEWIVERRFEAEDVEDDAGFYEGDDDFALIEDF